jgi:hypothetical protein
MDTRVPILGLVAAACAGDVVYNTDDLYRAPSATGIPTPPRRSQRQRRKLHRQTRPHGWKGGTQ